MFDAHALEKMAVKPSPMYRGPQPPRCSPQGASHLRQGWIGLVKWGPRGPTTKKGSGKKHVLHHLGMGQNPGT